MSSHSEPHISFSHGCGFPAGEKQELEKFARTLRRELAGDREFHCRVTTDAELRRLNREFRGQDSATDVLSFPGEDEYLGDLAISRERADGQAREFGHSPSEEIRILMLHGVLHLLGFDHENDRGEMSNLERQWRLQLTLPAGLIERVGG